MIYGGAFFLGYDLIIEYVFRHHDENNLRPKLVEHLFAMTLLGTIGGLCAVNTLNGAFVGGVSGVWLGFWSGWMMSMGNRPGASIAPPHIYYEADVSPEERERFEMMDQTEILAFNMSRKPGYGLC